MRSIKPQAAGRDLSEYGLTLYHEWPSLALGQEPNAGRFADSDVQIIIRSAAPAVSVGYLNSDLLDLLAPGAPLDGDGDGEIDAPLPGNVESAAVGDGQILSYTVVFANRGEEAATDVTLTLNGSPALDVSANPVVNLGDIGPSTAGSATFTATVAGASADSVEVQAVVSDGEHGAYDWFWLQNAVDGDAPAGLQLVRPDTFARSMTQTVIGRVQDASPVPQVTVQIEKLPGGETTTTTCSDPTPDDGLWSCRVNFGDLTSFTGVDVRMRATDEHGNTSAFGEWVHLLVDNEAPLVILDSETQDALADGVIDGSESLLAGAAADDFQAAAIEICEIGPAGFATCTTRPVHPGGAAEGDWSFLLHTDDLDGITHTVGLRALDGADNASTPLTLTFQIDSVAPMLDVTQVRTEVDQAPGPNAVTSSLILSGTVSDGGGMDEAVVRLQSPRGEVSYQRLAIDEGRWAFSPNLAGEGQYTFFVEAYDLAGNGSAAGPFTVIVDANRLYLPTIHTVGYPDLIVEALTVVDDNVRVVIGNDGAVPVARSFWVDVYIDPDRPPAVVNEIWPTVGDYGAVWGVSGEALPLLPGRSLTLTLHDAYYAPDLSHLPDTIGVGTPLYAQVDSANAETDHGAVLEIHEVVGGPYNNIVGPVTAPAIATVVWARSAAPLEDRTGMPLRPPTDR